ncbi:MAG: S-adenosylmethionine-dependent methyltransferase [Paraglaciecola sp.]|jgi:S-adenosylmethionine-dependent methyltransferase
MTKITSDQNFDVIADKFENNIYGTSKGQLRHELLMHYLVTHLDFPLPQQRVFDAGGGTGEMSKEMLQLGCEVTLTDISAEALQLAEIKCNRHSALHIVKGDILSFPEEHGYDLVVCHAVLEWLSDPYPVIEKLLRLTVPGGHVSLSFFNKDAQRFGNLLYGNFDYVQQGMKVKKKVRLSPNYPLYPRDVLAYLGTQPVEIVSLAGLRCFHDYLQQRSMQTSHFAQLKQAEIDYGSSEPYMWLGKYFHILIKKSSSLA